jgi:hypothetical protein
VKKKLKLKPAAAAGCKTTANGLKRRRKSKMLKDKMVCGRTKGREKVKFGKNLGSRAKKRWKIAAVFSSTERA